MVTTSGVDLLTGDVADDLTGRSDGHRVLQGLARRNLFTVEHGIPGWFSYQPLLRDLLRHLPAGQRSGAAADLPELVAPVTTPPDDTPPDGTPPDDTTPDGAPPMTLPREPAVLVAVSLPADVAATGMTVPSASELRAVERLITRLTVRFPDVPADSVRQIVNATWDEFTDTPIRDFVPVLVERNARERLRRGASGQPAPPR